MEKMRFIFILALSLWITGCQDDLTWKTHDSCFSMTISNALPVQIWLDGEEPYNSQEVCGVTKICFNQPFQCDDPIGLQFSVTGEDSYLLRVLDKSESILAELPFDVIAQKDYLKPYPMEDWDNATTGGSNPDWTTGPNPSVTTTGLGISKALRISVSDIPAGNYKLRYSNDVSANGAVRAVQFRKNGVSIESFFMADANGGFITEDVVLPEEPDEIRIQQLGSGGNVTTTIYSLELLSDEVVYAVEFTPDQIDACDQTIKLQGIKGGSPDEVIFQSDEISIKSYHACTVAIDYTNHKDFAGIAYSDLSPVPTFRLRIPAIFFEQDNPAEQEDHELSSGEIVRLYNKLEERRKLDIGFMPQYLHRKLQLVLMHDVVIIDGKEWIKREAYERIDGNKRYPLKRASVWLHDKNYIKENQL